MKTSADINELAAALAQAQSQFPTVERTETAEIKNEKANYRYRYASLASVLESVREPLAKAGLAIFQTPHFSEQGRLNVTLLLMHKSGQYLEDTFSMPVAQQTPQGIGSIISYARRYQLLSCLGLATDDDDAQVAEQAAKSTGRQTNPSRSSANKPSALPILPEQQREISKICETNGFDAEATAQQWYKNEVSNLTQAQAIDMVKALTEMVPAAPASA